MGTVYNTNIVTDGLIGCWDAANKRSYPGAGTTWTDLAGSNSATLVNDATFADVSLGAIAFDGTNDSVTVPIIDGQNGFSFSIGYIFLLFQLIIIRLFLSIMVVARNLCSI